MKILANTANAVLSEFDLSLSQFEEAEKKAALNAIVIPLLLLTLTSNILASMTWVALLSLLYATKISDKKQNASAFFTLLSYISLAGLTVTTVIAVLSL
ncbi:MAG: hypothetical protein PHO62_07695 [Sulfurimonas sp.]|uniref:hypothetical protein n=1 Tax=Sulfurimonas sp. TaxID=2022749 RepID=UPI0026196ABD|nr:hypothetical protein [Sulfurimonas sp.]MDD5373289.1 hypothetical protein [Sulfurimonas sp.]